MATKKNEPTAEAVEIDKLPRKVELVIDGKTYVSDPDNMLFLQNEEIEKILAEVGYHSLSSDFIQSEEGQKLIDPNSNKDNVSKQKAGLSMTSMLTKLHSKLIEHGARGKLVCHLLVPEGLPYSVNTYIDIRDNVLPKMTTNQVQQVIASFFDLGSLFKSAFPEYLIGKA